VTTRIRGIATTVLLEPEHEPVTDRCVFSLDHRQVIERSWLVDPLGQLSEERLAAVDLALHRALGIEVCPTR
jgi:mRNA-degrading endonuclease toxin of MazEF toxin-antitoxin module